MRNKAYKIKIFFLYLFVFSLGYEYWDPFGVRNIFTVTKLLGLLYFVFSLLDFKKNFSLSKNKKIVIIAFSVWLYLVLVSFVSATIYNGDINLRFSFLQVIFLLLLVMNDISNNPLVREKLFIFYIFGISLIAFFVQSGIGIERAEFSRLYFMGLNPNKLGNFSVFALLMLFILVFEKNRLSNKKYFLLLLIPNLLMLIGLSGSRGAFVGLFLGVFSFFLLKKDSYKNKFIYFLIGGISISIFLNYLNSFEVLQNRLQRTYEGGDTGERFEIWKNVLDIYLDYPIFGIGDAGYQYEMSNRFNEIIDPHNLFIYIMVYGGTVGIFLFLWFYINLLKKAFLSWKINKSSIYLALFFVVTFVNSKSGGIIDDKITWVLYAYILTSFDYIGLKSNPREEKL